MDKEIEEKILKMYEEKPYVSYKEILRQVPISHRKLMAFIKEKGISPLSKKEYVEQFINEHPFFTYGVIEEHVHYGQGNIARLAKRCGLSRNPHEINQMMRNEIYKLCNKGSKFDYKGIISKYGIDKERIDEIVKECKIEIAKKNHVSNKSKVIKLLETTELDYTNIARIVGCDLGYVSRIAKDKNLQRNCTFAEALVKNIRYYLSEDNSLSYEEIRARLNRCKIEKVIDIAKEMGVERQIVHEEDEISKKLKSGESLEDVSKEYGYKVTTIELIAMKIGVLVRDPQKDKKVIELLKKYPTCTYVEISNLINYNVSLVSAVAAENGFNRTIISYGGESKDKIVDMLKKNPKMTYKEIGNKFGRSPHTIWRIAKENNLSHKGSSME